MEAFLVSVAVAALAEIGDKTQLLALLLAARFRRPLPILLAIALATLANHTLAAYVGRWVASVVAAQRLRWILALSFVAMAVWTLIPDRSPARNERPPRFGVFATALVGFFLVETGDKTQIATAALAARYGTLLPVVVGTTLGILIADAPAVLLGEVAATRLPLRPIRAAAAALFLVLSGLLLLQRT
jgi:putative Ca2+/H+ antiporter (TMEM165/GDT1 family)